MTQITHECNTRYENNTYTTILQTDLGSAFDTVDTFRLLQKLHYYGLEQNELKLMESFMTNRHQYVIIDTFTSDIKKSPPGSVIQGSKLSALLYTIYTNEIPNLYKLMSTDLFYKITGSIYVANDKIDHTTINYVDDSTNIITSQCHKILKEYTDNFYKLLQSYYNINYLKINSDKTKFMIICKPGLRENIKNMTIQCEQYIITQSVKIKILGIYITNALDNTANVNQIIQKVNFRINVLSKMIKFANTKTKKILYESIIISVFTYCL